MWRELLHSYQVSDIASSACRHRFGCWGFLNLWRTHAPPFTGADIEFLNAIAGLVTETAAETRLDAGPLLQG